MVRACGPICGKAARCYPRKCSASQTIYFALRRRTSASRSGGSSSSFSLKKRWSPSGEATSRLPTRFPSQNRSEEHTSELQSRQYLVCRLLLEKKKQKI